MREQLLSNARIVLSNQLVSGTLAVSNGLISDIDDQNSRSPAAIDLQQDYLIPGLVELHTDNLEKHILPRAHVNWPASAAVVAHDAQLFSAGITTVVNALSLGDIAVESSRNFILPDMIAGIDKASANLKACHFLHLRCELGFPLLEARLQQFEQHQRLKLLSLMDHTPGQRQFANMDACHQYYKGKYGFDEHQMQQFITDSEKNHDQYASVNRARVAELARHRNLTLASHDDETLDHVTAAVNDGVGIAEFPTTLAAATASHSNGIKVMAGGPNLIRGQSHSGNVSAAELAQHGVLDVISSDYVPYSLLHAAFILAESDSSHDLPAAISMVTKTPANAIGLPDRGEIAIGKRADLLQVSMAAGIPVIRNIWSGGDGFIH